MIFGPGHGVSYASQERLADETGVDRADVGKILRQMAKVGLIEVVDAETLEAALAADGQPRTDSRLVAYRRVLGPEVLLTEDMAKLVSVGVAITETTRVKLSQGKRKTGFISRLTRSELDGTEGDVPPQSQDKVENPTPAIEGDVPPNVVGQSDDGTNSCTPGFEGDGPSEFEGNDPPPRETLDSVEADAQRVRHLHTESVDVSDWLIPSDMAGAPKGAGLTDDELYSADLFFGELVAEDRRALSLIKKTIGPSRFHFELEAVIAHGDASAGIQGWARSFGVVLSEERHAA
jgi:hypothetical protein